MAIILEEVDTLIKMGLFVVVQALVYLILTNSSPLFSNNKMIKSLSFKSARSFSINRMLAVISDFPQADHEGSPSLTSTIQEYQSIDHTKLF